MLPAARAPLPGRGSAALDAEPLYRAANRVERSLIRVEADEVTYNLHILVRFELELALFEGALALADLPEAWDARYARYLGLEVPDDADGVLQDVHWAGGAFGYFPTYSARQRDRRRSSGRRRARASGPRRPDRRGELAPLGDWLRENVHRHGRRRTPAQILDAAGCGPLSRSR